MEELLQLIEEKKFAQARPRLICLQAADIAEIITDVDAHSQIILFRILPKELAAETFVELDSHIQEMLIKGFTRPELKAVFDELFVDDLVDIIEEMPANVAKRIIAVADEQTRQEVNELLKYPSSSAGAIMTTEFVSLKSTMTVAEAFERIRITGIDKETIYTCYVTDQQRHLMGLCTIRSMVLANMNDLVGKIMNTQIVYANTFEDKEEVAKKLAKYGFVALPVVDNELRLVGIVTVDDAMDVLEQEATEDIHKMGALLPSGESYMKTPIIKQFANRIVWLLILMVSGILTGLVITHYENVFVALPLVVAFIPRLMDTGGNCGAQSSTLIIRALALDEVEPKDIFKIMFREFCVGALVGLTLAIVNVPIIWIMYAHKVATSAQVWLLTLAFGITLFIVAIFSKLLGCTLPILAKKCKLDPALMASPIITTIVDVVSVLLYFMIVQGIVLPVM
ncbi:MAG: magnesium transporter [Clostridia bacterium]